MMEDLGSQGIREINNVLSGLDPLRLTWEQAGGLSLAGDNIPLSANCKLSHNRKCTELAAQAGTVTRHDGDAESIADYIWDICPLTQPTAGHLLRGHVSGDHWGNTDV